MAALTNAAYLQRYGFVDDCFGTTMVDGKWLVKPESEPIRESLAATSAEEDEKLLSDSSLSIPAKTAIQFRRQLKIALKAQQEAQQRIRMLTWQASVAINDGSVNSSKISKLSLGKRRTR
ncbi:RBCMT [Symbiodinium necroappetens]|uniref:RBCMT protein n=1 Tax=Symbiodinium necroappetens TaxID=1628268 RepID=A0A813CAY9_9DINO|nr:RBCMT [Symbiodinium necroappetens]